MNPDIQFLKGSFVNLHRPNIDIEISPRVFDGQGWARSVWRRRAGSNRCIAVLQCARQLDDHWRSNATDYDARGM